MQRASPSKQTVLLLFAFLCIVSLIVGVSAAPPVAEFTGSPRSGVSPLPVAFTDTSTNSPTGWAWFFGDENWALPAWTLQTANAEWSPRIDQSSVVMPDSSIVLMGGKDINNNYLSDVWRSTNNGTSWTLQTASAAWAGRQGHSSAVMPDGSIVLMGGSNDSGPKNDVWRSTNNGTSWTLQTASAAWAGRQGHSSVAMPDGSIVLMGGQTSNGASNNDVWRSTNNGATWTPMTYNAEWSARDLPTSVAMPDGSIVLMGGLDDYDYSLKNDVWRSTNNGATWTPMTHNAEWSARCLHTSVAMPDGSIVLMGGTDTGNNYLNDVWRSTNNGTSWMLQNASAEWAGRGIHTSVVMPNGSIVMMGGVVFDNDWKNDVWRFQPAGSLEQNPLHTYTAVGTYQVALQAYNVGGYNSTRKTGFITVTGSPAPVAAFTTNVTSGPAPLSVQFTDQSTGEPTTWFWEFDKNGRMLCPFGGNTSTERNPVYTYSIPGTYNVSLNVSKGAEYNSILKTNLITVTGPPAPVADFMGAPTSGPAPLNVQFTDSSTNSPTGWAWFFGDEPYTQAWTEIKQNDANGWSARNGQSSVAMPDGRIVMMGGYGGYQVNDVWNSTDNGVTWNQMTASAEWTPRNGHTSVAMPDSSIVLMGGNDGRYIKEVWRSTDNGATWTELAAPGWPGRFFHTSVVMPDGSIVLMGGLVAAGNIHSNDVWRSTDNGVTWNQMTASAEWSARGGHSSVAMPDGSIVLTGGGGNDGVPKNDVWRSTDNGASWMQVITSGPMWSARGGHSGVAMPDGSIVLTGGGGNDGVPKNDVWRSTDNGASWMQVITSGPMWSARGGHSGVAMPDGSIVLMGGSGSPSFMNDVWRLDPTGSSAQNPSHMYTSAGTYNVSLQAYNAGGYNSIRKAGYIDVKGSPSEAYIIPSLPYDITPGEVAAHGHLFQIGSDWTDPGTNSYAVSISAPDVYLNGMNYTLTGNLDSDPATFQSAVVVGETSNVTVAFLHTTGWNNGVNYYQVNGGYIARNLIENSANNSIAMHSSKDLIVTGNDITNGFAEGIDIAESENIQLWPNPINGGNKITGGGLGISAYNSKNVNVTGSYVSDNLRGIFFNNVTDGTILDNIANNNDNFGISGGFSNNITVRNNTANGNRGGTSSQGFIFFSTDLLTMTENVATGNGGPGIAIDQSTHGTFEDNTVSGNAGPGIGITRSTDMRIDGTQADQQEMQPGILAADSTSVVVTANNASYNRNGIMFVNVTTGSILDNVANNNKAGIMSYSCRNITARQNTANDNNGGGNTTGIGIFLSITDTLTVSGNTAMGNNRSGIAVVDSTRGTVEDNTVSGNAGPGILIQRSNDILADGNQADHQANGPGIIGDSATSVTMTGNNASYNKNGILFVNVTTGSILDNMGNHNVNGGIVGGLSNDIIVRNNTANDNTGGIYSPGISFSNSNSLTISDNIVKRNGNVGIDVGNAMHGTFVNNTVSENVQMGINIHESSDIVIDGNRANLQANAAGIQAVNSTSVTTTGNDVRGNFRGIGYVNVTGSSNLVLDNLVEDNALVGLGMVNGTGPVTIVMNTISGNPTGLSLGPDVISIQVADNFFNNTINVGNPSGIPRMVWNVSKTVSNSSNIIGGQYIGGNYWAKPDGTGFSQMNADRGDGFTATPFAVVGDSQNYDYLPLAYPGTQVASFTGTPRSGTAPLNVQFNDTSTGTDITGWQWIFSDSSTVYTTQNLTHTFTNTGTYNVNHSITNSSGTTWKNETGYITVTAPVDAPVADFTGTPTTGTTPLPVQFTDSSTNTPTGWAWFFGDETYTAPWTQQTASAGWSARSASSSVVMPDGSIILMGGADAGGPKNDTWRSTNNSTTWTQQTANAGWPARWGHSSVVIPDGSVILMGGYGSSETLYNDVWRSMDYGVTWTEMNASAGWSARFYHSSVVLPDGSIILMGGADNADGPKNDTWRSTDSGATWAQQTWVSGIDWSDDNWSDINWSDDNTGWSPRVLQSSVAMPDGSIILMGGMDTIGSKNDTWMSTDNGATWTQQTASAGWPARQAQSSVVMPDSSIILMGGLDGSYNQKNDVWKSADNGATWTYLTASAGWPARGPLNSVVIPDGSIILMGGFGSSETRYNDVWRFVPTGSSAQSPSHTYTTPGTYQVALQAYKASGYNSTRKTGYITVTGSPSSPVADFTGSPRSGTAPLNVQFNDTSTGTGITAYKWLFSDGATVYTTQNLTHTFSGTGTYNVNHSVTSSSGTSWKNETGYITVAVVLPFPKPSGGYFPPPTDPNHDGLFEDLDGNGWIGFNDVVVYYNNMYDIDTGLYGPIAVYDYDHSGFIGFNDVVHLYGMIG